MYTCEIFLHHFLLLFSTSTTEPHSSAQLSSYSQSFVLLKSQHISLYLHFYSVVLYASFCLSHTHNTLCAGLSSVVFSFQCEQHFNSNQHSDTRISVVFFFVLLLCDVSISLALKMYACMLYVWMHMGVCPCGRYIKMREVGSSLFHFLLFSYLMSGIYMLCNICYGLLFSTFFRFFSISSECIS